MSAELRIGEGDAARLVPHPLRAAILGEVHARPFTPIAVPSRVLHFGFDTSGARAQIDRANLVTFCQSRGLPPGEAKKLMLQAFVAEAFAGAEEEERLLALALERLGELV